MWPVTHGLHQSETKNVHVMHPQTSGTGRPEDIVMLKAFNKMCDWLQVLAEQDTYTLCELQQQMMNYVVDTHTPSADNHSTDNRVYSIKYLKRKLIERYGGHIALLLWQQGRMLFVFLKYVPSLLARIVV